LLPRDLGQELGLAEETVISPEPDVPGTVSCGLGTPLLTRLVAEARSRSPVTYVRLKHDPPRPGQAAALGERYVVRNGVVEVLDTFPGEATYVAGSVAYVAEADDRHEGVVRVVVHGPDGSAPDRGLVALLDLCRPSVNLGEFLPLSAPPPGSAEAVPWIARRAELEVRESLSHVEEGLFRRHARDHARITEYFAALIAEARSPRRRVDPQATAAKVQHLWTERDTKLLDLRARFALRVQLSPAALLCAVVPVVRVRLRVRRRKEERELVVRLPAGAQALDRLACDGCDGVTARPALCDDKLHVLCEDCVPAIKGRPRCPACRPGKREPSS
jgi:hypothetical protein